MQNICLSCKLCCTIISVAMAMLFTPCAQSTDRFPQSPYVIEGPGKQLEDSLIIAEKEGRLMDFYIDKEYKFRRQGKYAEIINMSNWVEKRISKDDISGITLIFELRSSAFCSIGDYDSMFDDIEKSLEIPKPDKLKFRDGVLFLWLADFHSMFNQFSLAQQYINKAKGIISQCKDSTSFNKGWRDLQYMIHLGQGQLYMIQEKWDSAEGEFRMSRNFAVSEQQQIGVSRYDFFLAKYKGDFATADSIYQNVISKHHIPYLDLGPVRIEYIRLLLDMGNIEKAKEEIRNMVPDSIHIKDRATVLAFIGYMHELDGNYKLANQYLEKSIHLKDSLDKEYEHAYAKHVIDRFEMRQVEKSLQKERSENLRNIILIIILCIALAGVSIWVVIVVRRHRKRKRDHLIAESSLGNRNAALSSAVMMADNYKNVCENIKSILNSNESDARKIAEINRSLKESNHTVEPLHNVHNSNDETMQEFLDKLRYVHPDLTNAELRMAQMIFMNISNKDIAELQKRSLGTIKNQKYSLRKKLGTEMPMEQYLKLISAASNSELEQMANAAGKK